MIKIGQRILGKVVSVADGTYAVSMRGKDLKTGFRTKDEAEAWRDKNGEKRYVAVIWGIADGKKKLKYKTFRNKKAAEDHLHRLNVDVNDGTYRALPKKTFGEYAEVWRRDRLTDQELSTINGYLCALDRHLLPEFRDMTMATVQTRHIVHFRARLFDRGLARKTVSNVMNLLNLFFEDALEDGYLRASPMPKGRRKKRNQQSRRTVGRALEPGEFQALLANCTGPRTRLIVLIAALAGLRRGEVFALKWEDIDFEQNVIHVRRSLIFLHGRIKPKEGERAWRLKQPKTPDGYRDVDMSPVLKAELKEWKRQQTETTVGADRLTERLPKGLVFCRKDGEPMTPDCFRQH